MLRLKGQSGPTSRMSHELTKNSAFALGLRAGLGEPTAGMGLSTAAFRANAIPPSSEKGSASSLRHDMSCSPVTNSWFPRPSPEDTCRGDHQTERLVNDFQSSIKITGRCRGVRRESLASNDGSRERALCNPLNTPAKAGHAPVRESFIGNRTVLEQTAAGSVNESPKGPAGTAATWLGRRS